ncbi:hypothetical protein [Streptomyces sp. XH2]
MHVTPARAAETRDEHITELRTVLQRAVTLLQFSAGREAATDPE